MFDFTKFGSISDTTAITGPAGQGFAIDSNGNYDLQNNTIVNINDLEMNGQIFICDSVYNEDPPPTTCDIHIKRDGEACIYLQADVDNSGNEQPMLIGTSGNNTNMITMRMNSLDVFELISSRSANPGIDFSVSGISVSTDPPTISTRVRTLAIRENVIRVDPDGLGTIPLDLNTNEIQNVTTFEVETIHHPSGAATAVHFSSPINMNDKDITNVNDIYVKGMLLNAGPANIEVGDNLDMQQNNIIGIASIGVDSIGVDLGASVAFTNDVNMSSNDLLAVNSIAVDTISKSVGTEITVSDDVNFSSSDLSAINTADVQYVSTPTISNIYASYTATISITDGSETAAASYATITAGNATYVGTRTAGGVFTPGETGGLYNVYLEVTGLAGALTIGDSFNFYCKDSSNRVVSGNNYYVASTTNTNLLLSWTSSFISVASTTYQVYCRRATGTGTPSFSASIRYERIK